MVLDYQRDIDTVVAFLQEFLDADIIFDDNEPNGYWCDESSNVSVSINTKQNKRLQLYSLLHEAGHAIIRSEGKYNKVFPYGEKTKNKSVSRRIDVVREEVVAWEAGRELASDLGIGLDLKLWHNFVKKNLFDYVKWAYDPKKFKTETIKQ